jgi:hypothetical protein
VLQYKFVHILTKKFEHFEDPRVDERIILRWIYRKWDRAGGTDWIDLVQDMGR